MGMKLEKLTSAIEEKIKEQPMFFVATAADGRVNMSPKGLDSLRILSPNQLVWYNFTGSGNETASHIMQNNRMTLLFVTFKGAPMNIRLFGTARSLSKGSDQWNKYEEMFGANPAMRQIFLFDFDLVHTSCGFSAPEMELIAPRAENRLIPHFAKMTDEEIHAYQLRKNTINLDGQDTDISTKNN